MTIKKGHKLIGSLLLLFSFAQLSVAVTDADLEALEKQLMEQEAEEKRKAEAAAEAKRKAKADAKRKAEEERRRKEEEQRRLAEEAAAEEARRQAEAEARRKEEQARLKAEAEAKRKAEEAAAAEAKRQAEIKALLGDMVKIPAGSYQMGSEKGGIDELPIHTVNISAFEIGKFEVTFNQWDACVDDGGCGAYLPADDGWGRGKRPVIYVSWNDIQSFLKWVNDKTGESYRLPSEAEWEYVCRSGGKQETYCGGEQLDELGWYRDNSGSQSHPAGEKKPNGLGVYDMSGNVWELLQDCWHDSYQGAPANSKAWETQGDCSQRLARGSSWYGKINSPRAANRNKAALTDRSADMGFRLAKDL